MSYATEHIAEALKEARKRKKLSQRALSALAGVPQSHISKIESNAVDLRLSSLVAIARALDLEIELVPRKAVPAVQSVARSAAKEQSKNPEASKEIARALQAATRLEAALQGSSDFKRLRSQLEQIARFQAQLLDSDAMRDARKTIEAINKAAGGIDMTALKKAADQTAALRNALAHVPAASIEHAARPAYRLEDDDA